MASVEADGTTIEYGRTGEDEPLLLVKGLGAQLTDWPPDFVAMPVDAGCSVIRLDNRDAGLSTGCSGPALPVPQMARVVLTRSTAHVEYLVSDMAADAVGLLDALGIDRVHRGRSRGAWANRRARTRSRPDWSSCG